MHMLRQTARLALGSLSVFYLSLHSAAFANSSGTMLCKIETQYILRVENGTIREYEGLIGGTEAGDTIPVEIGATYTEANNAFRFQLKFKDATGRHFGDAAYGISIDANGAGRQSIDSLAPEAWYTFRLNSSASSSGGVGVANGLNSILITPDNIRVRRGFGELSAVRHFQNDWTARYMSTQGDSVLVVGLSCRNNSIDLVNIIEALLRSASD